MKKIFNRVLAAAIAIPMTLTQGVVMSTSAEDTGAKSITLDTFVAIPADQTESTWNARLMTMVNSLNGTEQEINKADFLAMLPETNTYAVMLKEVLADAANPVMTVANGVITVSGTADMTAYAQAKIYNKINAAAGAELTLDAFNKTVEYSVTVDANVLMEGKTVDVNPVVVVDGTELNEDNTAAYLQGLADDLAAQVSAQVGVTADIEEAMTVEIIEKVERAESWADKAENLSRTGSYATADEMMAAVSKFFDKRTDLYTFPASVDEAVARHGAGFNQAIELVSGITESHGYAINITADEVAALAKEGTNFEVAVSGGTYEVTFNIPDAEAAEVEAYVNANSTDEKYVSSIKVVEASVTTDGVVYFNVTREITMGDVVESSTTGTDDTSGSTTATTTTTTDGTGSGTETTETTTVTSGSDGTGSSTTETTASGTNTDTDTETTTTTTTTTLPVEFELETVEISAGVGYYFSHDENAFDLGELVESLILVGNIDGEATSLVISPQDYATYLTPAYESPKAYFESVEGLAYVANTLNLTFVAPADRKTAENFDPTLAEQPTVYIGVKGDATLDGVVDISDATAVLSHYAEFGASLTPILNEDANLNVLAYFLADVDTESKAGANTDAAVLDITDATNILTYYAMYGAHLDPDWYTDILA